MTEKEGNQLHELAQLARHSPIVNAHRRLLEQYGYPREGVIALAIDLAKQNIELIERCTKLMAEGGLLMRLIFTVYKGKIYPNEGQLAQMDVLTIEEAQELMDDLRRAIQRAQLEPNDQQLPLPLQPK